MALQTDDCDIRDVRMYMDHGGNGDYYMNLVEYEHEGEKKGFFKCHVNYRMAMSGGAAPHEVKMAFAALFKAMEKAELNKHPKND